MNVSGHQTAQLWRRQTRGFLFGFIGTPVFVVGVGLATHLFSVAIGVPAMSVIDMWALVGGIAVLSTLIGLGCAVIFSVG